MGQQYLKNEKCRSEKLIYVVTTKVKERYLVSDLTALVFHPLNFFIFLMIRNFIFPSFSAF